VNRSLRSALVVLWLVIASHARADQAEPGEPGAQPEEAVKRPAPQRISGAVTGEPAVTQRLVLPPFGRDRRGDVRTTAFFPFYFERKSNAGIERFVLPYFYRREKTRQADVALGLVWSLRGPDRHTFILPPLYTHRSGKDHGFGLLPLLSTGVYGGHYHTVIPPLLSWFDGDAHTHRWFVGPYYDVQTRRARWNGLFPIFWGKRADNESFAVVPPLFWRFTEEDPRATTTVVPPFYHLRRKDESSWGVMPLLFGARSPDRRAITIPPAIFHVATGKNFKLVTPVLGYRRNETGTLLVTPLYQRKRGDKNFDGVMPLFVRTWDVRDASSGLYLPPIYWHWRDPANRTTIVFPLFARSYHDGISDTLVLPILGRKKSFERDAQTWWVAPTFHWAWDPTSWMFNIHPLVYVKRAPDKSHTALAPLYFDFRNRKAKTHRLTLFPLYWDFKNFAENTRRRVLFPVYWDFASQKRQRRSIVGFPFYWDFDMRDRDARYTVTFPFHARSVVGERTRHFVLNTMTERSSGKDARWQFHFFPLWSQGGSDSSKWWSVLYGLAGYDRRGGHRRAQALWVPFDLD
jgi:hypothetical protein